MKKNRNNKLFVGTMAVMLTASLFMTGCASKKDLQNCQNENRELTNNYQDAKEKLAAAQSRVSALETSSHSRRKTMLPCREASTRV